MNTPHCHLAHGAGAKEIEGIEYGGDEVQAHTGFVGPIACRGGVSQKKVVNGANDEDGDEPCKLPLQQGQRDGFTADEAHQLVYHQAKAV